MRKTSIHETINILSMASEGQLHWVKFNSQIGEKQNRIWIKQYQLKQWDVKFLLLTKISCSEIY